jgi:hypothetical protein
MNKYFKVWMRSGAYFGIAMGTFYIFQQGNYIAGAIGGAIAGLLFGSIMASLTYLADKNINKRGVFNLSNQVNTVQSLIISLPFDVVDTALEDAVLCVPNAKITTFNYGYVKAKTGFTWKSFGEEIIVVLEKSDASTIIKINSKPLVKTTIVDYGKNSENVQKIHTFIMQRFVGEVSEYAQDII